MIQLHMTGIKEIESLSAQIEDCISLSQGALRVGGAPNEIKNYLQQILATDKADYYENTALNIHLKQKIASLIQNKYGIEISKDQIILTHGCIGGISVLMLSILEQNDEVIIPEPTYPVYQNIVRLSKGNPVFVSCLDKIKDNGEFSWALNVEKIKKATTNKTKAIIFSNPWNPTGYIVPKSQLEELVSWCEERKIYLIVDEVYEDYVFEGKFDSIISFIPKSNYIVKCNSFSKNFAMSGYRVGFLIIPNNLTSIFSVAQHSLIISPSQIGQWAASYALDHPELLENFYNIVHTNLKLTEKLLAPMVEGGKIFYQKPQAGFFMFIQTKEKNSAAKCMKMIQEAKVALIPGEKFGPSGTECLRLCYARNSSILKTAVQRFVNYWSL